MPGSFGDYVSKDFVGQKFVDLMDEEIAPELVLSFGIDPPPAPYNPLVLSASSVVTPVPLFPGAPSLLYFPKLVGLVDKLLPPVTIEIFRPEVASAFINQTVGLTIFLTNLATDYMSFIISQLQGGLFNINITTVQPIPPAMLYVPGMGLPARPISASSGGAWAGTNPGIPIQIKMGFYQWAVDLIPPIGGLPRLLGKIVVTP